MDIEATKQIPEITSNNIKHTTLKESPQYKDDLIKLIEGSFGYQKHNKFVVDFYPMFKKQNWENLHIFVHKKTKEVLGHIGVKRKKINNSPVAIIGGVCITQKLRGHGLFSSMFKMIVKKYQGQFAFWLLWSDLADFYKKYGFHLSGAINEVINVKSSKINYHKLNHKDLNQKKLDELIDCYQTIQDRYLTFERTNKDWMDLASMTSVEIYTKVKSSKIVSYFLKNKGEDLNNVIHEYGAINLQELKYLFMDLKNSLIWTPQEENLFQGETQLKFGYLLKIGEQNHFEQFLFESTSGELKLLALDQENLSFDFSNEIFTMGHDQFLTLFFGPNRAEEFKEISKPFYISGIDSN